MIPKECKRLAEVDFPIAVVSKHAAREKSIRHGHPSTLHLWWARRPLASSRAVLLALLLPDPCDEHCPPDFKAKARKLLPQVGCGKGETDAKLREGLLKFIGDFANWDLSANATYIEVARGLVKAAHPEETPLVVDPFAGGGSIPLEALRLGCDSFASDLNPVAGYILQLMLVEVPRLGASVYESVLRYARELQRDAEQAVAQFFPLDSDGKRPLAYFWAKTVRCEAPSCGAEIPLLSNFWLSKKVTRQRALRYRVTRRAHTAPTVEFEVFIPTESAEVPNSTAANGRAVCPACNTIILPKRLQELMSQQGGGTDTVFDSDGRRIGGSRLIAVAIQDASGRGREYRVADASDYSPIREALHYCETRQASAGLGASPYPDEPINEVRPSPNARGLSAVTRYGNKSFSSLFTARQKVALLGLADALTRLGNRDEPAAKGCALILAAALGKRADYGSVGTRWHLTFEKATCTFSKQALSNTWDFIEPTALGHTSGSYGAGIDTILAAVQTLARANFPRGQVQLADASASPLPDEACSVWFTDPPYYDAIPYADLSDFFFVWLKRLPAKLFSVDPSTLSTEGLTPKSQECVWNQSYSVDGRPKDGQFFEEKIGKCFEEGRRVLHLDGIGCVVFAHKTTEGWEALLGAMCKAGWTVTASWPIATERQGRLQSQNSAALATSVHLVCRRRGEELIGDWSKVLHELPKRVAEWMQRLQREHVRGADLVFACIGPALEIFSRYAEVETAEGREVLLAEYLEKVWEVVGRTALEQVLGGGTGALEEDARLTALFFWTLQSSNGVSTEAIHDDDEEAADGEDETPKKKKTGSYSLVFDVARRFAQPLGIHLPEWEGRIIEIEKGVVRLLPVAERAKQLFGEDGTRTAAAAFERNAAVAPQMVLFPDEQAVVPEVKGRGRKKTAGESNAGTVSSVPARREATTLDRVHAAMLLQRSGQANALRALLQAEQDGGPDFLRLANALSALYPRESEEKRLLDAMLLALPR